MTGDTVSKCLNEYFTDNSVEYTKEQFLYNFFDYEYTDSRNRKRKGLGLSYVTENNMEFYKDCTDDPDDWGYNNGELPLDNEHFKDAASFNSWLDSRFDWPEYVHIYDGNTGLFECFDICEPEIIFNKLFNYDNK